jgi:hypothetical protein
MQENTDTVICPHCSQPLALSAAVRESITRTLAVETSRLRETAAATARDEARAESRAALEAKDAEVTATRLKLAELTKNEADVLRRARELEQREQEAALVIERRLAEEAGKIRMQTEATVREQLAAESRAALEAKDAELSGLRTKVAEATKVEVDLLRRARELDLREQEAELAFERRLGEQASKIRAEMEAANRERFAQQNDQFQAAARERELQLEMLKRQVNDLQQRIASTPAHPRGESQEIELRELLARSFTRDRIEDVPAGTAGSDVLQHVTDGMGRAAGLVIWESKNTKAWNPEWLAKLRDDQRAIGADIAVLVTTALPDDIRVFGLVDGVWVTSWSAAAPVAAMLRAGMIEVSAAREAQESRGDKMSMLYNYLTGAEFRNRFAGVIEAYQEMHADLETEKRAVLTLWKKRERQLRRAIDNLAAFYGDVQGIAGSQLAGIDQLALSPGAVPAPMLATGSDGLTTDQKPADELVSLMLDLLPADGRSVGNKALLGLFTSEALVRLHASVGEPEYRACKDALIAQGRARRAPGQGGSVARVLG